MTQGRIVPVGVTPSHGDRLFALGEDEPLEVAALSGNDFTEVGQVIDLTDYDFLTVTMDTIGRATGQFVTSPGWSGDAAELYKFYFNLPGIVSANEIAPPGFPEGFTFNTVGPVTYPFESYSGAGGYCRGIPPGNAVPAHLRGTHSPPVGVPLTLLPEYTLQFWVNLDLDSPSSSWGHNFIVHRFFGGFGGNYYGIRVDMLGYTGPGSHTWAPYVIHYYGSGSKGVGLGGACAVTSSPGWQMWTFTFDNSISGLTNIKMYVNGAFVGSPGFTAMDVVPGIPPAGEAEIQYGDMKCWGEFDSCRLLNRVLSPAEIATSYAETTTVGVPVDTEWLQQILIDDKVYATRALLAGERRRWTDFTAPVRLLSGQHKVMFRLQLAEV